MKMRLPQGILAGARPGRKSAFHVVMAYDDFTAGKRAMDACNFLGFQLGDGVELRSNMWKFDILRHARLYEMAVEDAIEADVIIVANASDAGLPDEVVSWIDAWVPRKRGQTAALVALLDFTGDSREAARTQALLKRAAAGAKIDFLPHGIESPEPSARAAATPPPQPASRPAADRLASGSGPEGWGLND
jgi:hypothetical protein